MSDTGHPPFPNLTRLLSRPWSWLSLSALFLLLDYLSGPYILFPITFILPVGLAAWHGRLNWAVSLAVSLPLYSYAISFAWDFQASLMHSMVNISIRIMVLVLFSLLISKVSAQSRELQKRVAVLEGILPICSFCKKIRDKDDQWQQMESYISEHCEAKFSHSFCPECARKNYPDIFPE